MFSLQEYLDISIRLISALLFGAIVGLQRQIKDKAGGLRTHMLVSLGAAVFVLIPILLNNNYDGSSRAIQGVATGVGFLGAGEIWRETQSLDKKTRIHGLTSAAAIWVTSALGIAAGCGLWQLGLIATLLTWTVLQLIKKFEHRL